MAEVSIANESQGSVSDGSSTGEVEFDLWAHHKSLAHKRRKKRHDSSQIEDELTFLFPVPIENGQKVVTGGFEKHRSTSLLSTGSALISEAAQLDFRFYDLVRRFWENESLEEPMVKASKEELECKQHFVNNFSRLPSGEYMVRLPLKHTAELLGKSYNQDVTIP
ncbi:hypothetical protein ACLKA6_002677 [Drosophila palustris]